MLGLEILFSKCII